MCVLHGTRANKIIKLLYGKVGRSVCVLLRRYTFFVWAFYYYLSYALKHAHPVDDISIAAAATNRPTGDAANGFFFYFIVHDSIFTFSATIVTVSGFIVPKTSTVDLLWISDVGRASG